MAEVESFHQIERKAVPPGRPGYCLRLRKAFGDGTGVRL